MASKQTLVKEYLDLADQAELIESRMKEIKDIILKDLPPGTHPIAGVDVQVRTGARRFDDKTFSTKFPYDKHRKFYTQKVDPAKVKELLSPHDLDKFYTVGAPSVVIPKRKEG